MFSAAERMVAIEPFRVMALLDEARALEAQGRDIVHMEIGEPDFETPEPVVRAAQRALQQQSQHYTSALGLPALREAIAQFYGERYRLSIDRDDIVITSGASAALLLSLGVAVNRGEGVLLSDPGYPCNRHIVTFVGAEPQPVAVSADDNYQLSAAAVAEHWRDHSRAVMLASPSNPSGTVLSQPALQQLAAEVSEREGVLLVDEIYHALSYGETPLPSAAALGGNRFVINSFSKYFCMTGWRLGWLLLPAGAVEEVAKLAQNLYIAPTTLSQQAALAAFAPETIEIVEQRRHHFLQRRDRLAEGLCELGLPPARLPEGAFYLYVDSSRWSDDSMGLSRRLLYEAGVAVTPGGDFGDYRAADHLRFAYTTSIERIELALERLQSWRQRQL
ncbi:aminotransferase class I/II-fold pyridoxal phosphate-dependent enzyme [Ectothiorhodospiraceae bacterium BW-2]|nr:aminotransferase class I/II-fold pyridoxal phosphate-dependent enzyme [Ectothiorhodospiraceae bacterium BW-2]